MGRSFTTGSNCFRQGFPFFTGATGFDRMAEVVVACRGCSLGLAKKGSTTTTADNHVAVAGRVGFGAPVRMAA